MVSPSVVSVGNHCSGEVSLRFEHRWFSAWENGTWAASYLLSSFLQVVSAVIWVNTGKHR